MDDVLLSLDLGKTTGWAVLAPGLRPVWGFWELPGTEATRNMALENAIEDAVSFHHPTRAIIEAPLPLGAYVYHGHDEDHWQTNAAAVRQQLGLRGCALAQLYRDNVPCSEVSAALVRSTLIGTSRGEKKGDIKLAIQRYLHRHGWMVSDLNACDAVAVGLYHAHQMGWRVADGSIS